MNIVFVCMGNTCRSPMAEGILRTLAEGTELHVYSCGLSAFVPCAATEQAVKAAAVYGADISQHRSRAACDALLGSADKIVCLTRLLESELKARFPRYAHKVEMLGRDDVDDPYGGDQEVYDRVAAQIEREVRKYLP